MGVEHRNPRSLVDSKLPSSRLEFSVHLLLLLRIPSSYPLEPWTPSGRRCSLRRLRLTLYSQPSPTLRVSPRRPTPGTTSMRLTSGTWARRSRELRSSFDETNDKLTKALESLEEKEKNFKNAEEEVGALARR